MVEGYGEMAWRKNFELWMKLGYRDQEGEILIRV